MSKTVVISVGGSLINPGEINTKFLKKFKKILDSTKNKYILITGGGRPAREYVIAAKKLNLDSIKQDWVGIAATMLNAQLVGQYFGSFARQKPSKAKFVKYIVGGGDKPGSSSDYEAVKWAIENNCKEIINLTNVAYVYDKNPKLKGAKPLKFLIWNDFLKIVGTKWSAGLHSPFDPIASKLAKKHKLKVIILQGLDLNNLNNYLNNKKYKGTIIG